MTLPVSMRGCGDGEQEASVTRFVRTLAVQDWMILCFHGYLLACALWWVPETHTSVGAVGSAEDVVTRARRFQWFVFTVAMGTVWIGRGPWPLPRWLRVFGYRSLLFGTMLGSYFVMGLLLEAMDRPLWDGPLHQVDKQLLGFTPALWLVPWSDEVFLVEWFSFFYFSYFFLLAGILLPLLFRDRSQLREEWLFGAAVIIICGHVTYTLIPGVGPYLYLDQLPPLRGGFWWRTVQHTVQGGGAIRDIFPSLHTAFPVFFALTAFEQRREPMRPHPWGPLALVALNIVGATLFLRWHYAIDVFCGLLLAWGARRLAHVVVPRERAMRSRTQLPPVWEPFEGVSGAKPRLSTARDQ